MKKSTLFLASIATIAVASVALAQGNYPAAKLKGKALPAVTFTGINGKTMTNASFKGKVTIIDFYASWCGPCMAAAPKLNKIYLENKAKGLFVIGANAGETNDAGDTLSAAEYKAKTTAYQKEHGYAYTFATAADKSAATLKVNVFPTFFIVDKKGIVRDVIFGYDDKKIRSTVKKLLAEK